jgi:hypothetical protein
MRVKLTVIWNPFEYACKVIRFNLQVTYKIIPSHRIRMIIQIKQRSLRFAYLNYSDIYCELKLVQFNLTAKLKN